MEHSEKSTDEPRESRNESNSVAKPMLDLILDCGQSASTVFQTCAERVCNSIGVNRCLIWRRLGSSESIQCVGQHPVDASACSPATTNQLPIAVLSSACGSGCVSIVQDLFRDDAHKSVLGEVALAAGITCSLDAVLRYRGNVIGVVSMMQSGPRRVWNFEDTARAATLAKQVALLMVQVNCVEQERRQQHDLQMRRGRLAVIERVTAEMRECLDEREICRRTVALVNQVVNSDRCFITRICAKDKAYQGGTSQRTALYEHVAIHENAGMPSLVDFPFPPDEGQRWTEQAASSDRDFHFCVDDTHRVWPDGAISVWFRQVRCTALLQYKTTYKGLANGWMTLHQAQVRKWSIDDKMLVKNIAETMGIAIEHARMVDAINMQNKQLQQQLSRARLFDSITQQVRMNLDLGTILQAAADLVGNAAVVNRCLIQWIENTSPLALAPLSAEYNDASCPNSAVAYLNSMTPEQILGAFQMFVDAMPGDIDQPSIVDIDACTPDLPAYPYFKYIACRALMFIRTTYQGKPNGLLVLYHNSPRVWSHADKDLLRAVGPQIGVAIAHSNLLESERTKRQQLTKQNSELQCARADMEQACRSKTQFLSMMSHEIRTPMNAVIGVADLLLASHLSPHQRELCNLIHSSGNALLSIISDILDSNQLEYGRIEVDMVPTPLAKLVEEVVDTFCPIAVKKNLSLSCFYDPMCPADIVTNASRLRQILVNLLGNAVKFTPQGRVSLHVTARPHETCVAPADSDHLSPWHVSLDIIDSGIGIPADRMDRLFKWFSVCDPTQTRRFGGTGLGLCISERLARLLGGDIVVRSHVDRGSTFSLRLLVQARNASPFGFLRERLTNVTAAALVLCADDTTSACIEAFLSHWGLPLIPPTTIPTAAPAPCACHSTSAACACHHGTAGGAPDAAQGSKRRRWRSAADFVCGCECGVLVVVADVEEQSAQLRCLADALPHTALSRVWIVPLVPWHRLHPSQRPPVHSLSTPSSPPSSSSVPPASLPAPHVGDWALGGGWDAAWMERCGLGMLSAVPGALITLPLKATSLVSTFAALFDRFPPSQDTPHPMRLIQTALHPAPPLHSWSPQRALPPSLMAPALSILVAEDQPVNQRIVLLMLHHLGYAAHAVDNGLDALNAIRKNHYDVVLLDIQMPIMDGLTVARTICSENPSKRPYLLALTANAMHGDREMCLDAGMDDYLAKPIRLHGLSEALTKAQQARLS